MIELHSERSGTPRRVLCKGVMGFVWNFEIALVAGQQYRQNSGSSMLGTRQEAMPVAHMRVDGGLANRVAMGLERLVTISQSKLIFALLPKRNTWSCSSRASRMLSLT